MKNPNDARSSGAHFTPREVNALVPQLETIFLHIDACRKRVEVLSGQVPRRAGTPSTVVKRQLLRSQIEFLLEGIQENIDEIGHLGGVVKDLDAGLVDFLGWLNGGDMWLCWKRGEKNVGYWHSLNEGFSERQALPGIHPSRSLH